MNVPEEHLDDWTKQAARLAHLAHAARWACAEERDTLLEEAGHLADSLQSRLRQTSAIKGEPAMLRKAFVMTLHPGSEAEYARRHNPIWPELEATLRAHGVLNYAIFLLPATHQLFAYAEVEDEARWQQIAQTDVCRRWWAFMKDIMATRPDNSPVALDLDEVFCLATPS